MAEVFDFGLQQHKIKMDGIFFESNLFAVAGDTGRRLEIQLLDSNNMVQNTTGISLRLNANVAGQATYAEATLVDATKGLYELDLPNGMLIAPGNWQFQWQIIGTSGEKLHSFAFTGSVGSNLSEGGTEATNFYLNVEDLKQMQEDLVNGTFNSEVLETNIAEKLNNLEETYAPRLTEVTEQLTDKAEQSALNIEKARIDSFTTLAAGSTTGDAELIDGRVGADGVVYPNVGGAIRGQHTKFNTILEINSLVSSNNKMNTNSAIGYTPSEVNGAKYFFHTGVTLMDLLNTDNSVLITLRNNLDNLTTGILLYPIYNGTTDTAKSIAPNTSYRRGALSTWSDEYISKVTGFEFKAYGSAPTATITTFALLDKEGATSDLYAETFFSDRLIRDEEALSTQASDLEVLKNVTLENVNVVTSNNLLDASDYIGQPITSLNNVTIPLKDTVALDGEFPNSVSFYMTTLDGTNGSSGFVPALVYSDGTSVNIPVNTSNRAVAKKVMGVKFTVYSAAGTSNITSLALVDRSDTADVYQTQQKAMVKYQQDKYLKTPWSGKSWISYGDSITESDTWQPWVDDYFKFGVYQRYGYGGATVSNKKTDNNLVDSTRINAVAVTPDLIVVMGGTNDYGEGVPIGDVGQGAEYVGGFDESTFIGGLCSIVLKFQNKFPNARIFLASPWSGTGGTLAENETRYLPNTIGLYVSDYAKAVKKVAEYFCVPYIPVYENSSCNPFNRAKYLIDFTHPNADGGKRIAEVMIGKIKEIVSLDV